MTSRDWSSDVCSSDLEFDPGSGRTLAACLIHASRTLFSIIVACYTDWKLSGERVSNTWVTCPKEGDNTWKQVLIPHNHDDRMVIM